MKSLKQGIIQDKEVTNMRAVFGIDVSKASSEVAFLVDQKKIHAYTISNDGISFLESVQYLV